MNKFGHSSKQTQLIEMLARPTGATMHQIAAATGWKAHTVRGSISGVLKKKLGLHIENERNGDGASVYRLISVRRDIPCVPVQLTVETANVLTTAPASTQQDLGRPPAYTVADAMNDYLADYTREGKGVAITLNMIQTHILPKLGNIRLADLTPKIISTWHHEVANKPARLRSGKNSVIKNERPASNDPETLRRRRSTANRVLTVLKAALNFVWREGNVESDSAWRRVKPFRGVDAPVIRYLNETECQRLVKACGPDLQPIVKAALFTGCRYGEVSRLIASDYRADTGTLYIRLTKTGKPRHVVLTEEGQRFFDKVTKDKHALELMFQVRDGQAWIKSMQSRRMRDACQRAGIEPPITYHILRHTYGSLLAMKGAPMAVVAKQLGHANTQVTEKHYAHVSPGYVAQVVRDSFPELGVA